MPRSRREKSSASTLTGWLCWKRRLSGVVPHARTGNEDAVLDEEEGNAIALASQVCRHVVHIAGVAVLEGVTGFNKQVVGQETPPQGRHAPS